MHHAVKSALVTASTLIWVFTLSSTLLAAELHIGAYSISITPDKPVALWGQMNTRISNGIESPVTATVLALERREADQSLERSIMVACDLVAIPKEALARTRELVLEKLPEFPVNKIFLSATHTHTGPVFTEGVYDIPREGVMQPTEYIEFFAQRVSAAIVSAWNSRKPGKVGWGLGHAVVALNRRSVYNDGTSIMYGNTTTDNFRMLEGYEDHGVEVLCLWDADDKLIATAINLACPAQEVEGRSFVNADFWHQVREQLRAEHGPGLHILGWTGAAGDQSPHVMYRKAAEERMLKLRKVDRLTDIANRIVAAFHEAYAGAVQEKHADAPLIHTMQELTLPRREVTQREYELAKAKIAEYSQQPGRQTLIYWHGGVVKRYEAQQANNVEPYTMELHVVRLGDVAIATNPFELYTDYGLQMKTRSPALQTFVVQLAGPGTYLPTERAVAGGGYSAIAESNEVGPDAGQILVEKTLQTIKAHFPTINK